MCLARQEILLHGDLIAAHQKEISRLTKASWLNEKKASDKKIESAKDRGRSSRTGIATAEDLIRTTPARVGEQLCCYERPSQHK